ncbi:peptide-methionine (S)-S-oxide reductase MsrA [Patescibacteria group bacterium]|nr:peptide-methionine (S)-S-oxide reductase MsrA [Patescibacteria group bacterium]
MENIKTIVFAGGCFWCTEAIFKRIKGVVSVISGYAGGKTKNPTYEEVSTGETGYAEAVEIKFDPRIISFEKLLKIFWATHDPTTKNRQGSDVGTQYRSAIFYLDKDQKQKAEDSKKEIDKSGKYRDPSVTEIFPLDRFYTAEEYHQNYYENNKYVNQYCSLVIDPKITKLIKEFNGDLKDEYIR